MSRTKNLSSKTGRVYRKTGHPHSVEEGQGWEETELNDTLNTSDNTEKRTPTLVIDSNNSAVRFKYSEDNTFQTLLGRMGTGGNNTPLVEQEMVVRRLTPLECERLQGFPDGWTDIGEWTDSQGKKRQTVDSQRYKALGNSIGLPFWEWMAGRMVAVLKEEDGIEDPTMASLFDGIGGFPLVYQRQGCKPVWASEIEEFPIAVTKKHFKED